MCNINTSMIYGNTLHIVSQLSTRVTPGTERLYKNIQDNFVTSFVFVKLVWGLNGLNTVKTPIIYIFTSIKLIIK